MVMFRSEALQGSRNNDTDTLQRLFAALDNNDLAGAQRAHDELKSSASEGFNMSALLDSGFTGFITLPVLGLLRTEAEAIGAELHDKYYDILRDRPELPRGDEGWADLVQYVNYSSRKALENRSDA